MRRRRATKATKADDLILGSPEIDAPSLRQAHRFETAEPKQGVALDAVGITVGSPVIGGRSVGDAPLIPGKKRRVSRYSEVLPMQLQRLREQGHDVKNMRPADAVHKLNLIWPKGVPFPSRKTIDRARGYCS